MLPKIAKQDPLEKVNSILKQNWYPWIVPEAVEWLEENLNNTMMGVEFGGGLSTGWFCQRLKFLHTIECSTNWSIGLMSKIAIDDLLNYKWYLHYINCDWNKDSEENRWYMKNNNHKKSNSMLEIMETRLTEFKIDHKIDFCSVDGSVRYETFLKSKELIKDNPGAILCIDNTEKPHRAKYVDTEVPKSWKKFEFINEKQHNNVEKGSKTTIFVVC